MIVAGIGAAVLLGTVAVFQAALALGAPWGAAAWGGQHPGVLPRRLRIASGVAAVAIYPIVIALILAAAGVIDDGRVPVDSTVVVSAFAVLLGLGALANFASRSPRERWWGPVALAVAVSCAVIALSR